MMPHSPQTTFVPAAPVSLPPPAADHLATFLPLPPTPTTSCLLKTHLHLQQPPSPSIHPSPHRASHKLPHTLPTRGPPSVLPYLASPTLLPPSTPVPALLLLPSLPPHPLISTLTPSALAVATPSRPMLPPSRSSSIWWAILNLMKL